MQALEQASVHHNIIPFTEFIEEEMAMEWELIRVNLIAAR